MLRRISKDLRTSAKWAAFLFIPWVALGYFGLASLGGFHGLGGDSAGHHGTSACSS